MLNPQAIQRRKIAQKFSGEPAKYTNWQLPSRVPPDMWVWPQVPLEGPPPPPPLGPPPYQTGPPRPGLPEHCKKSQGGWGEEGGRGRGGKGFGLREGPPIAKGMGGDPPNTSWGQTHIPKGPNLEKFKIAWNFQDRLKFSISLEIFNLDLRNSPQKIGGWWVARLKNSSSLENFKILKFFKIWALRDLGAPNHPPGKLTPNCPIRDPQKDFPRRSLDRLAGGHPYSEEF